MEGAAQGDETLRERQKIITFEVMNWTVTTKTPQPPVAKQLVNRLKRLVGIDCSSLEDASRPTTAPGTLFSSLHRQNSKEGRSTIPFSCRVSPFHFSSRIPYCILPGTCKFD